MESWGHYGTLVYELEFAMCMIAWNLLALDLVQQIKRYNRRKEERKQWESSSVSYWR